MTEVIPSFLPSIYAGRASELQRSSKLERTIEAFFDSFHSSLTAKEYKRAAFEFFSVTGEGIRDISELSRDHIIFYQKWIREKGLSEKTELKKLSAISSLMKHLAHEGFVDRDLSYGVKRPKNYTKKETADFSDYQVRKIFEALDPDRKCFTSHRAILAVGFFTGLRSTEIRTLKIENLMELDGHRILKLEIKGKKPHEVPLQPFVYRAITDHINKLKELGANIDNPKQWLFPAISPKLSDKPLSPQALRKILHHKMKMAGIPFSGARRYSPHSMRATVIGHMLNDKEIPLEDVQRFVGHASPTTTQGYNKRSKSLDKSPAYIVRY